MARQKLIFLGLDGLGLDLAADLGRRGIMPALGGLMEEYGALGLDSPLPEVSPVCWTGMFSGANPGEHGIYGFAHPLPGTHSIRPVDSNQVAAPRLWELLSREGRPSVVLNVPLTYPVRPLQGIMVSGFVTPELFGGVYPPEALDLLEELGYRPEAELDRGRTDTAGLLEDVAAALTVRLELFRRLWEREWDLYLAVVTDTDRVNHFAWPALWEDDHPLAPAALAIYRAADRFLAWVWERARPLVEKGEASLVMAADHSFGPIRSEVYLNRWLVEKGYLCIEGRPPRETVLPATRALALDPGRIYLHREGLFPGGRLRPGPGAEALLAELSRELMALRFSRVETGPQGHRLVEEAPIARVHRGADLYHGPLAQDAPDLICEAAPGYSLRAGLDRPGVFGLSHLSGAHRPRGALCLCCPPPGEGERPGRVEDLFSLMAGRLDLGI